MNWSSKDFTMWISCLLFVSCFVVHSYGQRADELCRSAKATSSCGFCTKAHADCAWCTDRSFSGEHRCDTRENLRQSCAGQLVHQPPSKIEITQDRPLGSPHPFVSGGIQQVQPQQFQLTMKPGETLTFSMKYQHLDAQSADFYILHSDTKSQGVSITFTNSCPSHRQTDQEGRGCSGARAQEVVTYNISVTLQECVTAGDAVVSIGVTGVRDVVALYITPVCGCECEKLEFQEVQSSTCSGFGNLICGACVCSGGRQGKRCECDPSRQTCARPVAPPAPPAPVAPSADPCAGLTCLVHNGHVCGGRGQCECGRCVCYHGFQGQSCECPASQEGCIGTDGKICSDNGVCDCGRCSCFDESLRTPYCQEDDLPKMPDDMVESHTEGPHPPPDEPETDDHGPETDEEVHPPTDDHDTSPHEPGDEVPVHPEPEPPAPGHHPVEQPETPEGNENPSPEPEPEPKPEDPAAPSDDNKDKVRDQGSLVSDNTKASAAPYSRLNLCLSIVLILVGSFRIFGSL